MEASYTDKRYRKKGDALSAEMEALGVLENLSIIGLANVEEKKAVAAQAALAQSIAHGVVLAKDLVGAPSNSKTPLVVSAVARRLAKEHPSLTCHVLEKVSSTCMQKSDMALCCDIMFARQEECEELKMGGFLSVQKGSKFPPQFIHMTYQSPSRNMEPNAPRPLKVALIGKGLTFDSGGYNLKVIEIGPVAADIEHDVYRWAPLR
jgi:leucyl aminopeptidase